MIVLVVAARSETVNVFLSPLVDRLRDDGHVVYTAANGMLTGGGGQCFELPLVRGLRPISALRCALALGSLVRSRSVDVIHANSPIIVLMCRAVSALTRTGAVCVIHGTPERRLPRTAYFVFERLLMTRRHVNVVLNASDQRSYRRIRVRGSSLILAPCGGMGVDERFFSARRERHDPPTVAWMGRNSAEKRPELARSVAALLTQQGISFRLAAPAVPGDRGAASDGAESNFVDPVTFLDGADVLLNTSSREGFGMAMAEAMAMGIPVVATSTNGSRQIHDVVGGRGIVLAPDEPNEIARACSQSIESDAHAPEEWKQPHVIDVHVGAIKTASQRSRAARRRAARRQ